MMKINKVHKTGLWITFAVLFSNLAVADNNNLGMVLSKLASIQKISTVFIEIKDYRFLNEQIKLSGELKYIAPDTLIKKTIKPEPEYFKVKGDVLTLKKANAEEQQLLLSNYPLVEMFVEAYRGVLSGNLRKLEQYYAIDFSDAKNDRQHKQASGWTIKLTPTDEEALEYIDIIIVEGAGSMINRVTVVESGGDKSILMIKKPNSKK